MEQLRQNTEVQHLPEQTSFTKRDRLKLISGMGAAAVLAILPACVKGQDKPPVAAARKTAEEPIATEKKSAEQKKLEAAEKEAQREIQEKLEAVGREFPRATERAERPAGSTEWKEIRELDEELNTINFHGLLYGLEGRLPLILMIHRKDPQRQRNRHETILKHAFGYDRCTDDISRWLNENGY